MAIVEAKGTIVLAAKEITFTEGGTGNIKYNDDQAPGSDVQDGDLVVFNYDDADNVITRRATNIRKVVDMYVFAEGTISLMAKEITFTENGTGNIKYNDDEAPGPEVQDGNLVSFQYKPDDNVIVRRAINIELAEEAPESAVIVPENIAKFSNGSIYGVFAAPEGMVFRIGIRGERDGRRALTVEKFNQKVAQGTGAGFQNLSAADKTAVQSAIDNFPAEGLEKFVFVSKYPQDLGQTLRVKVMVGDSIYDDQGNHTGTIPVEF